MKFKAFLSSADYETDDETAEPVTPLSNDCFTYYYMRTFYFPPKLQVTKLRLTAGRSLTSTMVYFRLSSLCRVVKLLELRNARLDSLRSGRFTRVNGLNLIKAFLKRQQGARGADRPRDQA